MTNEEIRDLLAKPTITAKKLHATGVLPLSLNGIYEAVKRGEIDVMQVGRKKPIITASLRRKLGLEA